MKTIKEGYLLKTYTDKKNKQTHKAFLYVARTKEADMNLQLKALNL